MIEEWRSIPGHDGYEASNLGRIRSVDRWVEDVYKGKTRRRFFRERVLRQTILKGGYLNVTVVGRVHAAVMLAFRGPPPSGHWVAHNDGVKTNCRLDNLRYDTPSGNHADKFRHGTHNRGTRNHRAKLTEAEVLAIRASEGNQRAIATQFGVSQGHISIIRARKQWSWYDAASATA